MLLLYVKVFVIGHLLPFSLSDSADVRIFFQVYCEEAFPRTKLYPRMIKHCVTELHKATASKFSHSLRHAIAGAGGPVLHANLDLWTSKMSNKKYIGESTQAYEHNGARAMTGAMLMFCVLFGDDYFLVLRSFFSSFQFSLNIGMHHSGVMNRTPTYLSMPL